MLYFFVLVKCDEVSSLPSGNKDEFTDGTFSYIEFSCDNNYHLVGNSIIQCQTDGSWNGSLPECGENLSLFFFLILQACYADVKCSSL